MSPHKNRHKWRWIEETLRECQKIVLSPRDARIFAHQLLSPPSPSEALRRAAAEYRKAVDEGRLIVQEGQSLSQRIITQSREKIVEVLDCLVERIKPQ